jgi:hypothetical protein
LKFLLNAITAVQRNAMALLIYAVGILLIQAFGLAVDYALTGGAAITPEKLTTSIRTWALVTTLIQAPLSAAITAIAFARIGKDMDRPLWRSPSDRDALQRFFQLWLVLILASTALLYGLDAVQARELPLTAPLLLLYILLSVLTVPVGACIMFSGSLHWREFGHNLAPLLYQFPRTLLLGFLMLMQFMMAQQVIAARMDPAAGLRWLILAPVVTVIGAYIDCVVFAGTWLICMEHRNADRDIDFDF